MSLTRLLIHQYIILVQGENGLLIVDPSKGGWVDDLDGQFINGLAYDGKTKVLVSLVSN
jgi:hypothetical protein